MSEASHGEHVEIVRRGLGQHFNATDAMAHFAKSKVVVNTAHADNFQGYSQDQPCSCT